MKRGAFEIWMVKWKYGCLWLIGFSRKCDLFSWNAKRNDVLVVSFVFDMFHVPACQELVSFVFFCSNAAPGYLHSICIALICPFYLIHFHIFFFKNVLSFNVNSDKCNPDGDLRIS